MANSPRPGGRQRRIGTSGGGNAKRRTGSGLGGSVGGFSGGSSGSGGDRGSGSNLGLLAVLAMLLFGSSGSNKKSGCLKRILILVLVIAVISYLSRACSGSGLSSLFSAPYDDGTDSGSSISDSSGGSSSISDLLGGLAGLDTGVESEVPDTTVTGSGTQLDTSMFKAHEPDRTVSTAARQKYTTLRGNGEDDVTIMVYMCATDLESRSGMATRDLNEMLKAKLDDEHINLIVETGGTSAWQNNTIPAKKNMIYRVTSQGLEELVPNLGRRSMVEPDNLGSFIEFCAKNYPANRNFLILWDHGGGSISGYGYDELYPNGTMTLDEVDSALRSADVKFDFVGYDACLMATLETALVSERYSDYLLASEAVEPGTGWYYTNFLSELSENSSIETIDLGKTIIDDFVTASKQASPQSPATLSLIDLAELSGTLPPAFKEFSSSTADLIDQDQYAVVSNARSGSKNFSTSSEINQIDLIHFASRLGTDAGSELVSALSDAVKYNRCTTNVSNAYGVSVYFPNGRANGVNTALNTYDKIGMDESYADCIKSFASVSVAGQATSSGTGSALDVLLGGTGASDAGGSLLGTLLESAGSSSGASSTGDLTSLLLESLLSGGSYSSSGLTADDLTGWLDTDRAVKAAEYVSENRLEAADLIATEKGGHKVLSLTEDQWALISTLEKNVFLDDGEGYIDLGRDNVVDYTEDGDLILDFDGNWMALNGQIVACYFVSNDTIGEDYTITERIPALLNGERVNIMVVFSSENPYGVVLGASPDYDVDLETSAKGLIEIVAGDQIDFLCDYYSYDGEYRDSYLLGEQMTATGSFEIYDLPAGGEGAMLTYRVTDIYGNAFWTQPVEK